jgi:hypothetical protein
LKINKFIRVVLLNNIKRKNFRVVSTQLVDNGSERERYAQTQKQIQKKRKKKTINGGMLKARCRTSFFIFI